MYSQALGVGGLGGENQLNAGGSDPTHLSYLVTNSIVGS